MYGAYENFSELHNAIRADKVWQPMCVICIRVFKAYLIISVTIILFLVVFSFKLEVIFSHVLDEAVYTCVFQYASILKIRIGD